MEHLEILGGPGPHVWHLWRLAQVLLHAGIDGTRPGLRLSLKTQIIAEVSVPHAEHRISFAQRGSELLISSRHGAMKWPLRGL